MVVLRLSNVSWWYACETWEKLKRATFIPAFKSLSIISTDLEAGLKVETIFVFGVTLPFPSVSTFSIAMGK
ncbi:hypothetical protein F3Y22_tig00012635pilonHSYRG00024 [Hibiscus syriacus]|uniref:Uncharacterized protein n=1 Tax=Hibiscus syriacus TaxID=106335 RepID=A0A6A3C218_HIBSY|nr:hypothetical protein F3Y22_tig00012635pilonHSYRG00024 [Hibiscus syriacus]